MNKVKLIAELGWNFVGDMKIARDMVKAVADAGADFVKFQTWKVGRLTDGPWDDDGRRQIYEKAELSEQGHYDMKECCEKAGVQFLTSVFSEKDLSFVRDLTTIVKIPSPEASNFGLVERAISLFDHVLISAGATFETEWQKWIKRDKVTMMHCVSSYPCEPENFRISKLEIIKEMSSGRGFGFSGHYPGIWDAVFAISLGAFIVEKHFTLDHELPGRDNKFALLPCEFEQLREYADACAEMRSVHLSKDILECEADYRKFHKGRWDRDEI
jgi:N,N'-diacetyllegionaminate synthase